VVGANPGIKKKGSYWVLKTATEPGFGDREAASIFSWGGDWWESSFKGTGVLGEFRRGGGGRGGCLEARTSPLGEGGKLQNRRSRPAWGSSLIGGGRIKRREMR